LKNRNQDIRNLNNQIKTRSYVLGIHVSQEADNTRTAQQVTRTAQQVTRTAQQVWGATIVTFLTKCLLALAFAVPVLFIVSDVETDSGPFKINQKQRKRRLLDWPLKVFAFTP
jgi:hypothetical protein